MAGCDTEGPSILNLRKSFGGLYSYTGGGVGSGGFYENLTGTPNVDETRAMIQLFGLPAAATSIKFRYTLRGSNANAEAGGPEVYPDGVQRYKWQIRSTSYSGTASVDFEPGGQTTLQEGDVVAASMERGDARNDLGTFEFNIGVTGGSDFFMMLVNMSDEGGYLTFPPPNVVIADFTSGDFNQRSRVMFADIPEVTIYGPPGSGLCEVIGPCNCLPFVPCSNRLVDDFERPDVTDHSWGSDSGWQYVGDDIHHDAQVYESGLDGGWNPVDPQRVGGIITTAPGAAGGAYMRSDPVATGEWNTPVWTLRWQFAWEVAAEAGPVVGVVTDGSGSAACQVGGSSLILSDLVDDTNGTYAFAFAHDTPYYLQIRFREGSEIRAKVWRCADPEPTAYQVFGVPVMESSVDSYLIITAPDNAGGEEAFETAEVRNIDDCAAPKQNQPVEDEVVGVGDGSTTVFYTRFPYNPVALDVSAGGIGTLVDPTDPAGRAFTFSSPPSVGSEIRASYRHLRAS